MRRPILYVLFSLALLAGSRSSGQLSNSSGVKLLLDDGLFNEDSFVRQIAIPKDDTVVLTSDFSKGVRTFDMTNGELIGSLEGHALEGDVYYEAESEIFATTGDRKIRIWNWKAQKLVKTIFQPFHSQFIKNVYIDSKKRYLFAGNAKYSFDNGKIVAGGEDRSWAQKTMQAANILLNLEKQDILLYFWNDEYYLFHPRTGQVNIYDCFSDRLLRSYTLSDYQPGDNNYFDHDSGRLFVGFKDGVRIIRLSDGSSDYASFDRHKAYNNLDETSCYGISPDGNYLIAGSNQGVGLVVLKKIDSRKGFAGNTEELLHEHLSIGEIHTLHHSNKVVYTADGAIVLLDLDSMEVIWNTESRVVALRGLHLAPDSRHLYIGLGEQHVNRAWFEREYPSYDFDKWFSREDRFWGTFKQDLCVSDIPSDLLPMWENRARTVRLALDQGTSLESVADKLPFPVQEERDILKHFEENEGSEERVYSPTRHYSVGINDFGASTVYEGERRIGRIQDPGVIYVVKYSSGERYIALGGSGRWVTVMDLKTGQVVQRVYGESYIESITFSFDSEYLFTSSLKNEIMMWRLRDGRFIRKFIGSNGGVRDTETTTDGKTLVSIAGDGSLRLWDVPTGQLLVTAFVVNPAKESMEGCLAGRRKAVSPLLGFRDNNWVVVTPDGHFDSSDIDQTSGLHWAMADSLLRPLPIEIFMRDYYEPRLLSKVFKRKRLASVRPVENLNRILPATQIVRVDPEIDESSDRQSVRSMVTVTVNVEKVRSDVQKDVNGLPVQSGAYDLRLFRDGQLVAQWPDVGPEEDSSLGAIDSDQKREGWRRLHRISVDAEGKATVTFRHVRLPDHNRRTSVDFTAYAFNADRVKSLTAQPFAYQLSRAGLAQHTRPRAYLILMAVNANQSHWNLEMAVPSAERALDVLRNKLREDYSDVTEIQLYSDLAPDSPQVASTGARKSYLRSVLDILADRPVDPALRKEIDPFSRLRAATPDDAVVLYVASHGYVDPQGTFYIIPYDTGTAWGITEDMLSRCSNTEAQSQSCNSARAFLDHSISSADLAAWWHGVDAGQVIMILDSCHSGAAPGEEFRPAPLGDPGLGQLSYDKAMQLLASSQPTQTERGTWISGGDGQTLLTAALERIATSHPQWTLTELMKGTQQELPRIIKRLYPQIDDKDVQLPELLDFSGRKSSSTPNNIYRRPVGVLFSEAMSQ